MARNLAHRFWSRTFRLVPSIVLAEPFECFWALYGLLAAVAIAVRTARHQYAPALGALPRFWGGDTGVYAWVAALVVAALLMGLGLLMAGHFPLDRRPRFVEGTGLLLFAALMAQEAGLALINAMHGGPLLVYNVISTLVLSIFTLSALVRVLAISSPAGVMAVSRVSRIRLIRDQLRKGPES